MTRCIAIFGLVGLFVTAPADVSIFTGAPPAPPGYATYEEAVAAVMTGKVPRVKTPSPIPPTVVEHRDIEYCNVEGTSLRLDLYAPKGVDAPAPGLVLVHGGGWRMGNRRDCLAYSVAFAERGYVAAQVSYRLSPAAHFPAAVQDVKCAIRWLRAHAAEYGVDPDRIAVLGGSAGGHLSLMAAYADDPALDCASGNHGVSSRVQAVVNLYGVTDCTVPIAQEAIEVIDFIGKRYSEAPATYELASPLTHLTKDDPPTLTFHGTIDELVPIDQADRLHQKLDALGVPNYYDRVEGWPHSMDLAQPLFDRCVFVMARFLDKYLAKR